MKVLYIVNSTAMDGGATKSFISMIKQVIANGIDTEVICPDNKGLALWLKGRGIKVYSVPYRSVYLPTSRTFSDKLKWLPRFLYYSFTNFRARKQLKHIAGEVAPDIIHENSSSIDAGYHVAKSIGVPDIIHIREFGEQAHNMKVPGRVKRLKSQNVFSIPITRGVAGHLGQDANPRSRQIYDGIVTASDFRFNEGKEKWFLYAGRLEREKGIGDLLEAYADYTGLVSDPYPLYICGSIALRAYYEELKAYVEAKGIGHKVKWLGDRSDIADFMYKTAATIIPSRNEGLGRVMPEAMANGSLCVAKNVTGTKEQLENGLMLTGAPIALSYESKSELTKHLLKITDTIQKGDAFKPGSEFRQMIDRSQRAVIEYFSEEKFGEKICDFYEMVLRDSSRI